MHVHSAAEHDVSRGTKWTLLSSVGVPGFAALAKHISKSEAPGIDAYNGIFAAEVPHENNSSGFMAGLKLSGKQIFHLIEQLLVIRLKLNLTNNVCCHLGGKEGSSESKVLFETCAILQSEDVRVQMSGRLLL